MSDVIADPPRRRPQKSSATSRRRRLWLTFAKPQSR
jgi:hypothetical protein